MTLADLAETVQIGDFVLVIDPANPCVHVVTATHIGGDGPTWMPGCNAFYGRKAIDVVVAPKGSPVTCMQCFDMVVKLENYDGRPDGGIWRP